MSESPISDFELFTQSTNSLNADAGFQRYKKKESGSARFLKQINSKEEDTLDTWERAAEFAHDRQIPVKVIGSGSNLYITKEGFDGLFVAYRYSNDNDDITINEEGVITSSAGITLDTLVNRAAESGLDLSYMAGIPGTVGGAVLGNAGSSVRKRNIGEVTIDVRAFDLSSGKELTFDPKESKDNEPFFGQRSSHIKKQNAKASRYIIRRVSLKPQRKPSEEVKQQIAERLAEREKVTKEGEGTAGSFFASATLPEHLGHKNGKRMLVRDLIREGLARVNGREIAIPDLNINGARFSPKFSFLTTEPQTTDHDVAELLSTVLETMQRQYDFTPSLEVDIVGAKGSLTINDFINKFT